MFLRALISGGIVLVFWVVAMFGAQPLITSMLLVPGFVLLIPFSFVFGPLLQAWTAAGGPEGLELILVVGQGLGLLFWWALIFAIWSLIVRTRHKPDAVPPLPGGG